MIKKIIVSFGLLFSLASVAQEGTSSPYSYYGIGDVRFKGTAETRAMGGVSVMPDSIHINLQNPARLAGLKLTTFSVGGSHSTTNYNTNSASEDATTTTVDYLAFAFPAGKLGISAGLMPYSSVGYKIRSVNTETEPYRLFTGSGGLNRVFLGAGYQLTKNFSIGADVNYNFGDVETKNILAGAFVDDVQYGTRELNMSELSGFNVNIGLTFDTKINDKFDFFSSVTYTPESTLKSTNERNIATIVTSATGSESVRQSIDLDVADSNLTLPSKIAFGAGFGIKTNWFVGAEITLQDNSKFGNRYEGIQNATFENAQRYSVGGYFVPNYKSFSNYWSRVTYRAGLKYENTGLVVKDTPIKDYGVSLGLGMPIGGAISNLNIGFEYGRKGTTHANLIKENYANLFIGLSLNDKWFERRKYE